MLEYLRPHATKIKQKISLRSTFRLVPILSFFCIWRKQYLSSQWGKWDVYAQGVHSLWELNIGMKCAGKKKGFWASSFELLPKSHPVLNSKLFFPVKCVANNFFPAKCIANHFFPANNFEIIKMNSVPFYE